MFRLTIQTDNAAFDDDNFSHELARILRQLAERAENLSPPADKSYSEVVRDINGNRIGEWECTK